jgi:hypothetical protein
MLCFLCDGNWVFECASCLKVLNARLYREVWTSNPILLVHLWTFTKNAQNSWLYPWKLTEGTGQTTKDAFSQDYFTVVLAFYGWGNIPFEVLSCSRISICKSSLFLCHYLILLSTPVVTLNHTVLFESKGESNWHQLHAVVIMFNGVWRVCNLVASPAVRKHMLFEESSKYQFPTDEQLPHLSKRSCKLDGLYRRD